MQLITTCSNCGNRFSWDNQFHPVGMPDCPSCGFNNQKGWKNKISSSQSGLTKIETRSKNLDSKIKVCIKCSNKMDNNDIICKKCGSSSFIWEESEMKDISKEASSFDLEESKKINISKILERSIIWTKHGRSSNEHILSQFPKVSDNWEKIALINLEDFLIKNLVDMTPSNGKVFNIGNEARFISKLSGDENILCNFKELIKNKNFNVFISYHEYPTYPLIYILLQTPPIKHYAMQSIEILADFADIDFQEFAIVLNKNKSMFIDIFNEHNKNTASVKVEVHKEFCDNIVKYIDKANTFLEKINMPIQNFAKAGQLFFTEHPLPMPQSVIDKPKESSELKNILKETIPNVHKIWWKFWTK